MIRAAGAMLLLLALAACGPSPPPGDEEAAQRPSGFTTSVHGDVTFGTSVQSRSILR